MKQNQTNSFALGFAFVLMLFLGILIGVIIQPSQPSTTCVFSKSYIGGGVSVEPFNPDASYLNHATSLTILSQTDRNV